jgi:hypothetical protein
MRDRYPVLDALMRLSEGQALSPDAQSRVLAEGAAFITDTSIGYVLMDRSTTPESLATLAVTAFALEHVASEGQYSLYRPAPDLPSTAVPR